MKYLLCKTLTVATALSFLLTACDSGPTKATLELTGNDEMKFSKTSLVTSAPVDLTVKLANVGKIPKEQMGHNFVLLKTHVSPTSFAAKVVSEGGSVENDYLPESLRKDVVMWTKLLGPGESETVTAKITKTGTYTYVCTFPGHSAVMKGTITVR